MSEESQISKPNPQPPKKRGAPVGNQNAFKHGFYSRHFTRAEIKDLSEMERLVLDDEIELVRALMRRVLESAQDHTSHAENIETLRAICQGNFTLTRLIRTHFLKPKEEIDPLRKAFYEILATLDAEQALENQERENKMKNFELQNDDSIFKWEE